MSQYFHKLYEPLERNVELDWYHYATKTKLRNATGVDRYKLTAKSELASLKVELDKIDVDKLKTVPVD